MLAVGLIIHDSIGNNITQKTFDVIYNFGLVFRIRFELKFFQTFVEYSKKI